MSAEIKPCPFCGKPATPWEAGKMANCELHCGDIFPMPIQWWNTRPIEDALRAENERLRAALEKIANEFAGCPSDELHCPAQSMMDIARAALEVTK